MRPQRLVGTPAASPRQLRRLPADPVQGLWKSPKDRGRSIAELRHISRDKPETQRDLEGGTRNRHLTFLGQLLRRARSAGIAVDPGLAVAEFRAKRSKRGRDERATPGQGAVATFFTLPVFTGCRDWNHLHEAGAFIFHRAAYFGPLLAHYQGMRREDLPELPRPASR